MKLTLPKYFAFPTRDLAATMQTLKFYTVEQLGAKQELTPEGYLLCRDVPIARTGTMIYGPNEVPLPVGPDGIIKVHREEDQVFAESYMNSFVGKSVVDDHPTGDDEVNPKNWRELTIGVVLNPRRGIGMQSDLLIADLLITDADGIEAVRAGKREVSCGYNADYEEIEGRPGEGRQLNMIANHVALVEAGRCGPRCAIGDKKTVSTTGESEMKFRDNAKSKSVSPAKRWFDAAMTALRAATKTKDEAKIEEAMKDAEEAKTALDEESAAGSGSSTHIHMPETKGMVSDEEFQAHVEKNDKEHAEMRDALSGMQEQMKALQPAGETGDSEAEKEMEGNLEDEAPPAVKDKARKAKDSMYLADSFQETVAGAEILVPGIRIPTFDKASKPGDSLTAICKFRRTALDLCYATTDGKALIETANGKPMDLAPMKCNQVRSLFHSVVAAKKAANNKGSTTDTTTNTHGMTGPAISLAEINQRNAKFWAEQNK